MLLYCPSFVDQSLGFSVVSQQQVEQLRTIARQKGASNLPLYTVGYLVRDGDFADFSAFADFFWVANA